MKPIGKGKLSKRDGEKLGFPVFPLSWNDSMGYKETGYFPEAVINFLALLGWNPGTEKELFSLDELIKEFSLERVHKSGARFDPEKTKWYNQHYLQEKNNQDLIPSFQNVLINNNIENKDENVLEKIIGLIKERATFVSDFWELSHYFFIAPSTYDEKAIKKQWKEDTAELLLKLISVLNSLEDFTSINTEKYVKNWIAENNLSFGKIMPPLRLVIVGELKGPHIFDILEVIGKQETINRIKKSIEVLN